MRPLPLHRKPAFAAALVGPFLAAAPMGVLAQGPPPTRWTAGLGWFDVAERGEPAPALELAVDREGPVRFLRIRGGGAAAWHGAAYAYGAFEVPIRPHPRVGLTPSLGAGLYRKGGGVDLGSALAFRSAFSLELGLADGVRASVFLYHLSNAGIGRRNPGVEVVGLTYSVTR